MPNNLVILPKNTFENQTMVKHIEIFNRVLDNPTLFYFDYDTTLDLKKLLIENTYKTILIGFLAMDNEFPELQAVRSLALHSVTVLYCPGVSFIKGSHRGGHNNCDFAQWYDRGKSIQINACRQSDVIVVQSEDDRALIEKHVPAIPTVLVENFNKNNIPGKRKNGRKTSIIILTFNQYAETRQCVESLRKRTQGNYELIFVDNGSLDDTQRYLAQLKQEDPSIQVIANAKNLGFSAGNNQGIACATGDYILLLNNDVILTDDWLERMIACLESDPAIGVVGPVTNNAVGQQLIPVSLEQNDAEIQRYACMQTLNYVGSWFETHRIIGFCFLMRRAVIERAGTLDDSFGPGGYEDYDYCLRIKQAGYKIMVASDVFVYHIGGHGYAKNNLDYDKLRTQNIQIFIDKWCRRGIEILDSMPDGL